MKACTCIWLCAGLLLRYVKQVCPAHTHSNCHVVTPNYTRSTQTGTYHLSPSTCGAIEQRHRWLISEIPPHYGGDNIFKKEPLLEPRKSQHEASCHAERGGRWVGEWGRGAVAVENSQTLWCAAMPDCVRQSNPQNSTTTEVLPLMHEATVLICS